MVRIWWRDGRVLAAVMLLATLPLWFVSVPPLIDFVGHMGRYHVQLALADSPALQRNWAFEWHWVGNTGVDLLIEPLGRALGVERAAWLVAAALPPLMIWGQVRLARAVHGAVPASAIAAFPFALAYPWQYGLVNYWLGVALALHAAAWWIARSPRPADPARLVVATLVLWTVHIYGWAAFAIILGSRAVVAQPRVALRRVLALWPLAAPLLVMAALGYGGAPVAAETLGWFSWQRKFIALGDTLRDQNQLLDMASLALAGALILGALIAALLARSRVRIDAGLALAAGLLLAAIALLPYQLIGSAYADARLWPVFFMVALLAINGGGALVATAAMLAFAVRIVIGAIGFHQYDIDYTRHLAALDHVARGSRIAVFTEFPCVVPWRRPRLDHLDGMAIARRDAFTNGQWDVPGAQLLIPLAARGTPFNADPSELVRMRGCPRDLRPVLAARLAMLPRDRFDYVWLTGWRPETLPPWPGLQPVFADDRTILYRIVR